MSGGRSFFFIPQRCCNRISSAGYLRNNTVISPDLRDGEYKFKVDIVSGEGHFPACKTLLCPHVVKDMRELTRNFACVP